MLKKWRTALEQLPQREEAVGRMHRNLSDFGAYAIIALLCHLVKNQDHQRNVVAILLRQAGEQFSTMRVQSVLNQIHQAVRKENGDRNFRVAY